MPLVLDSLNQMRHTKTHKPPHCWVFKASWRGTALRLRIEADDLEYAYKKAENMVRKMEGGPTCLEVIAESQVY